MVVKHYSSFLIFLCVAVSAYPQANHEDKLDKYLSSYVETGDFSGTVLIARGKQVIFAKTWGFADLAHRVPNQLGSKFKLASVSKQFTAAAILILEQENLLNVDDPVSEFIPDYPAGKKIHLHHLLTHSSGIPDIYSITGYAEKKLTLSALKDVVAFFKNEPLLFQPGMRYSYSNSGYTLLAYIIELVSGHSYGDFVTENIFRPSGMNSSGEYDPHEIIPGFARGYDPFDYTEAVYAPHESAAIHRGSGSLYSTVEDLHKWILTINAGEVLSEDSRTKMLTDHLNAYGYGVSVYKAFGTPVFGHDGRMPGFIADLRHYSDEDLTIILLGNIQTGIADYLRRDLAAIILGKPYESRAKKCTVVVETPGTREIESFAGVYRFAPNFEVTLSLLNGRLFARANEGENAEMLVLPEERLFCRTLYAYADFLRNAAGEVEKIQWTNNDGNTFTGMKIKSLD